MDIVERLRLNYSDSDSSAPAHMALQAADEIDRLRRLANQRKTKKEVAVTARNRATDGLDHWRAEAERFEAALKRIVREGGMNKGLLALSIAAEALEHQ